jgi:hypothetical protein
MDNDLDNLENQKDYNSICLKPISNLEDIINDFMSNRQTVNGTKKEQILEMTVFQKIEFFEQIIRHHFWKFTLSEEETYRIRSFLENICKYDFWGEKDRTIGFTVFDD